MGKFLRIVGYIFTIVALAVIVFIIYFNAAYPKVDPPTNEKVTITQERIERGKYLANHVTVCMDCHSQRDWSKFSGPIQDGTLGIGGEMFDEKTAGVPGTIYSKNITPAGIADWTDGGLMRVITNGVTKDGKAIFPLMPYLSYNSMTQEDLYSVVAYVRSLKPVENETPESQLNFPLNLIVKTIPPHSYTPAAEPDRNNPVEYGKYLVQIGGCADCHTPQEKGTPLPGMRLAGGFEFTMPAGVVRTANITPDSETGIGLWTKENFINRFKAFNLDSVELASTRPEDFNTPMPWTMYAGMTEEDLSAVYEYLKTVTPVNNRVNRFTPAK